MNNSSHIDLNGECSSCPNAIYIFFTTAMAIISSTAFIGNILIIVSIYKTPILRTGTNYYFVNMAVSDFLVSLTTWPLYLTDEIRGSLLQGLKGPSGTFGCKVGSYFRLVSQIVSILSLVLIAVDRFIATVFPLKASTLITRKVRAVFLFATWLIPLANCTPIFYFYGISEVGQKTFCLYAGNSLGMQIGFTSGVIMYNFAPLIAIIIIYSRIMNVLRRRTQPDCTAIGSDVQRKRCEQSQNAMKIFKSILAAYFVCLSPYGVYSLLEITSDSLNIVDKCKLIRGFCYYLFPSLSTAINPVILFSFSSYFRQALKNLKIFSLCKSRTSYLASVRRRNVSPTELMSYRKTQPSQLKNNRKNTTLKDQDGRLGNMAMTQRL